MAEAPAQIQTPISQARVEANVIKSGAAAGKEAAKTKLGIESWFNNARINEASKIDLAKTEASLKGNLDASPKVRELGVAIVGGVNGIGNFTERAAKWVEQRSYKRAEKATEYEKRLQEIRNKPIEAQEKAYQFELSNKTLAELGLIGQVGESKGGLIQRGKEAVGKVADRVKERFYSWRADEDNRAAESDLSHAIKYGSTAKALHGLADNFEIIFEDKGRTKKLMKDEDIAIDEAQAAKASTVQSQRDILQHLQEATTANAGVK